MARFNDMMTKLPMTIESKQTMAANGKTKNIYSAHNFITRVSFSTQVSVHYGDHNGIVTLPHGSFLRGVLPTKVEVSAFIKYLV